MKKIYLSAALAAMTLAASAQSTVNLDVYDGATLTTEDLNGTARYVGMGGAMEALGADISTIGTNPAGVGLFRKNQVSGTLGIIAQEDGKSFQDGTKVTPSFDQLGFVISSRMGLDSYMNIGFNYHKSRNFNYVLSAAAQAVNGSSQNRQTYIKGLRGDLDKYWGESQVDKLYYNMINDGISSPMNYVDATSYDFNRATTGYIGEYDINLSGNIHNRIYLGATLGIKSVHYYDYSEYFENLQSLTDPTLTSVLMTDDHQITGTGFDIKVGAIFRPIEESPFRVGLSIATPTWYKLTSHNTTRIGDVAQYGYDEDFRFNTPWKFGASLGYTIGSEWALGLSYEYADYTTNDMRGITDSYYDYDGYYNEESASDQEMKRSTNLMLCGVSTLKAGVEFRPDPMVALRLGYNYVSPMYKKYAYRDQTLNSSGVYMASTTDYTNWQDTHRLTVGAGFTFDNVRLDIAYQYSMRKGDFYPFMNHLSGEYYDNAGQLQTLTNEAQAVEVKDNRHQILTTLTYTF